MKRNYKKQSTEVDFSKPINIEEFKLLDDCFGNLFDMSTSECRMCADCDLCGAVFDKTALKELREKAEKEKGPFADTYDFPAVGNSGLVQQLKSNPGVYTREDLFNVIQKLSKCDMPDMINDYIKSMFIQHNFVEKNGFVCLS